MVTLVKKQDPSAVEDVFGDATKLLVTAFESVAGPKYNLNKFLNNLVRNAKLEMDMSLLGKKGDKGQKANGVAKGEKGEASKASSKTGGKTAAGKGNPASKRKAEPINATPTPTAVTKKSKASKSGKKA